jgi:hypothetical protein
MKHAVRGMLLFAVAVAAIGCDGRIVPRGRLLNGGTPYVPPEGVAVHIAFFPMSSEGSESEGSCVATFNREDSTFRGVGRDGKGLLPGKYRVCIQVVKREKDLLKGAFGAKSSPMVREITSSTEELTLDLAKPYE